ncbi:MAG: glycosyltransferase family 2 protein [Thermodesulfobacteriota bacterium]|nr:glycosyltransferase family 2 protein [Thermodesulfobacteriota bacterium]
MKKPKISLSIIAKNEADRIGRLLNSAKFADEVLVVDSGSTDGTQDLCKKLGAKVVFHEWAGYAAQKQFAMEHTSCEWILNLDADEEISDSLAEEIQHTIKNAGSDVSGFSMPRLSKYLDKWIKHGGWYPDRKVRLVRRGKGTWKGEGLHEQLIVNGKIEQLSEPILHHVYRNISDHVVTINRFSDIYAVERGPAGGWFVLAGAVHALGKFAECYLWKLGFLDGIPGLVIAMNSAWYVFLKHAKAWESGLHV